MNYPVINAMLAAKKPEMKQAIKLTKKVYKKGSGKVLKNYFGKPFKPAFNDELVLLPEERDEKYVPMTAEEKERLCRISGDELIQRIRQVGLEGLSGSGFPVAEKFKAIQQCNLSHKQLLINGAECDLGLYNDQWLISAHKAEILESAEIICQAMGLEKGTLAMKAIGKEKPGRLVKGQLIDEYLLPYRYPIGEEHALIKIVLDKSISKEEMPANHGILVMNVQTVFQIGRILRGYYDNGRFVTFASSKTAKAEPVYIHFGDKIIKKLREVIGNLDQEDEYTAVAGGSPLNCHIVQPDEEFSKQITFAGFVPKDWPKKISNENKCRGCGGCSWKCPAKIKVKKIVKLLQDDPDADLSEFNTKDCIHCGSCIWICHGNKIPMAYVCRDENE